MVDANKAAPGPWHYVTDPSHFAFEHIVDARGHIVAKPMRMGGHGTMEANGHLISAAREVLLSLDELLAEIDFEIELRHDSGNDEDWADLKAKSDRGHAALAKAKGEAQRIEQERRGACSAVVPGDFPPPGTISYGADVGGDDTEAAAIFAINGSRLLDFDPARLEALDRELGA